MYVSMSNPKAARAEATRRTLIRVGRSLFAKRGFDGVSAEEIVAAAKVTRGALYHHFDGKEGLFRAVVADVMSEVHDRLAKASAGATTPLEAVEHGIKSFLQQCVEPEYQRVLLIDGPAVLGWHAWRNLDLEYGLGLLRRGLEAAAAARQIVVPDVETATHVLAGALIDGAMLMGLAPGDAAVRRRVEATVLRILQGLSTPPEAGERPDVRSRR
jgi:AcrR family transcriptional regulator